MASEAKKTEAIEGGKFLTFLLKEEEYGIEILRVREIMGLIDITPVPQTPSYVKGVINLRGKVFPVIDLRTKFDMPEAEYTEETCIVVVDLNNFQMGIIIDTVLEVLDIKSESIEPAPSFGAKVDTDYIYGMGKIDDKVKILLDITKVLTTEELVSVSAMQK